MYTADRFDISEAGSRLRKKLIRENPGVEIHHGCTIEPPLCVTIHSDCMISVPAVWAGFPVRLYIRGDMPAKVQFVRTHEDAVLPSQGSDEAAGFDLTTIEDVYLDPCAYKVTDTGWKVAIPTGYEGQVRPRSGLAAKQGVTVLNSPGTIDSDYRGDLKVIVSNTTKRLVKLDAGTRIAQLVVKRVPEVEVVEVESFEETTERGEKGFGSTGL